MWLRILLVLGLPVIFAFLGLFLRVKIKILQKLMLPASLIGGLVGLALLNEGLHIFHVSKDIWQTIRVLPAWLIQISFAGLFLGRKLPTKNEFIKFSWPMLIYGQASIFGQMGVAISLVIILKNSFFPDLNPVIATTLTAGWQGGHGTVTALREVWKITFEKGWTVGLSSATVGMLVGAVMGMWFINIAVRKNFTAKESISELPADLRTGLIPKDRQKSAGKLTIASEALESLFWHAGLLILACLMGQLIDIYVINEFLPGLVIPGFVLAMFMSIIIRLILTFFNLDYLIDYDSVNRISNLSLELLVVSALITLPLADLAGYLIPFIVLMIIGTLFQFIFTMFLAPRILPDYWFERAIVDFGQECGAIPTGLLLLRVVDPDFETPAAPGFAFKQLLHTAFSFSILVAYTPFLLIKWGLYPGLVIYTIGFLIWLFLGKLTGYWYSGSDQKDPSLRPGFGLWR